ncbi:MAG: hypothetical protein NC201_01585 [Prevotella sp.]|nr:hypothetical protein [Bacteroides sp.]MCM1365920.1 hypothetical protein [Prevotella sp.]MCM1436659.1 hypothetical protein [Prevotella sp.]
MKKTTLLASLAVIACASSAQTVTEVLPYYYSENFEKMNATEDHLSDGWSSTGIDAIPLDENLKMFFGTLLNDDTTNPEFGAPYFTNVLISDAGIYAPFVCTSFEGKPAKVNQWIISPEIEINDDYAELYFDFINYAISDWLYPSSMTSSYTAPFKVFISEGSSDPKDFTQLYSGTASCKTATSEQRLGSNSYVTPINGYKGKKVRLALVAEQGGIGMMGWTNLNIGQYAFTYANNTETIAVNGDEIVVSINIGMKTPLDCPGVKAVLEYNGQKYDYYFKKKFGNNNGKLTFQLCKFSDNPIKIADDKSVDYTVTFTPDITDENGNPVEGLVSSVVTGTVKCAQTNYPASVVMEEATASGCGWCPRGMGAAKYYADLMNEYRTEIGASENAGPKFIPIMVHSYMNYADPMNQGVESYVSAFSALNGTGLPLASFNRSIKGKDPADLASFQSLYKGTSIYDCRLNNISSANETITFDDEITVDFDVRAGFTSENTYVKAAVILTENDVRGFSDGYNQENYLVTKWPNIAAPNIPEKYFEKFILKGEWAQSVISYSKMVYQEVARGIWPSYNGANLKPGFELNKYNNSKISFKIPENIVNLDENDNLILDKFDVIVLILDSDSGEIVAADKMNLKKAKENQSVEGIFNEASTINVTRQGNILNVSAPEAVNVALYTVDGTKLATYTAADGNLNVNVDYKGIVIVRAEGVNASTTTKVVF